MFVVVIVVVVVVVVIVVVVVVVAVVLCMYLHFGVKRVGIYKVCKSVLLFRDSSCCCSY